MDDFLEPAADDPDFRGQGGVTDLVLPPVADGGELEAGVHIDRYVVLRALGGTRHAEVYAAHDPELDRRVAVKLMSRDVADEEVGYRRMRAEAQAAARLVHPNVVKIHDVGNWRGRPYIAREFIDGAWLGRWIRESRATPRRIREVMVSAGRGLAAIHAAGLVHRDVNPRAVFVGEDGRARVTDMDYVGSVDVLALARADDESHDSYELSMESREESESDNSAEFSGGSGVFADSYYAAPEQLVGLTADARSDQFAYCVVLYEALYGTLPFGRGTATRRLSKIERGKLKVPTTRYSRRTFAALRRGLSADPADRFAGIDGLLAALMPRRRTHLAWTAGVGLCAATAAAMAALSSSQRSEYCASVDHKLAGVWDADRADQLKAAFESTGLPYAEDLRSFTENHLDAWVEQWTSRHDELCEARARGADTGQISREIHCLSLRRGELASVVDTLTSGETRSVENAARIVRELRSVESCSDPDQWVRSHDQIEEAADLGRGLATLSTLLASGRADEAVPLADSMVEKAKALGHSPSMVRALGLRAQALGLARSPDAEAASHEAFSAALAASDYGALAAAATVIASRLTRDRNFEEAERWLDHAEAAVGRDTGTDMPGLAAIETSRGRISALKGDSEDALKRYRRALDLRVEAIGPEDDRIALYRVNVGQSLQNLGRFDDARDEFEGAWRTLTASLGPEHPNVAKSRMALCTVLSAQGEYKAGLVHGLEAERILTAAYGRHRTLVADAMLATAMAHSGLGHVQDSIDLQQEALEIYRATTGARSYRVALTLNNLGLENYNTGRYVEALPYYQDALSQMEEVLGSDHLQTASVRLSLADTFFALNKHDEARALLTAVRATIEDRVSSDRPLVASWLAGEAEFAAIDGRHAEAVEKLEHAAQILVDSAANPVDLGELRLMLASEMRYVGRGDEADRLEAETVAILQVRGVAGALAIRDAGRFRQRIRLRLGAAAAQ